MLATENTISPKQKMNFFNDKKGKNQQLSILQINKHILKFIKIESIQQLGLYPVLQS